MTQETKEQTIERKKFETLYNADEKAAHPFEDDPYPPKLPRQTEKEHAAAEFYLAHPEYWIHPIASSEVAGDKDRATIRVHKAMAAYAEERYSAGERAGRISGMQKSAKAMCSLCAMEYPLMGEVHRVQGTYEECKAAAIRQLIQEQEK